MARDMELFKNPPSSRDDSFCKVSVEEDGYLFSFDVSEFPKDRLSVEVSEDGLVLCGRHLTLPPDADLEKLEASYRDGVLQVAIPKLALFSGRDREMDFKVTEEEGRDKAA